MKFYIIVILGSILLYNAHSFLLISNNSTHTSVSLEAIYIYNLLAVFFVCSALQLNQKFKNTLNSLGLFVCVTILKMTAAIIILFPLFNTNKENLIFEVLNFFVVYFIFQIVEVIGVKDLLK
tara:strand:- start:752 stop:1117 length:366 start_codon:yes stop_codon:yes gene_type:complete